jgi:hypothetical protein
MPVTTLLRRLMPFALLAVPVVACSSTTDGAGDGSLVVGVQAEDFGPLVGQIHIVAKVAGAVVDDESVAFGAPGALPKEIPLHGATGAKAEVLVEAFPPGVAVGAGAPVVSRLASANLVAPPQKKLLRIVLEQRCLSLPGGGPQITCAAPTTCRAGGCATSDVPADQLEDYDPGWPAAPPDICRPVNHGAPEVIIGSGQTDYLPLADGQVVPMELGPQGGHHIWIAARMKNLRQSGSTTMITGHLVDDPNAPVPPMAFVFTFDRDEGSYCKLFGLRYQLDSGAADLATDYKRFLGKKLAVTVTVTDSTKASASSTATVQIGDKLICPDGTDSCNTP